MPKLVEGFGWNEADWVVSESSKWEVLISAMSRILYPAMEEGA